MRSACTFLAVCVRVPGCAWRGGGGGAAIDNANEEDAKYFLFQHLGKNATVETLREYCEVAIAADGYPRMQELGRKMMETLPLRGLSHLWWWVGTLSALHVCVPLSHCRICMYCTGLHTKCTALAVHCHIQFCCSNQFAPFASSPCTAVLYLTPWLSSGPQVHHIMSVSVYSALYQM